MKNYSFKKYAVIELITAIIFFFAISTMQEIHYQYAGAAYLLAIMPRMIMMLIFCSQKKRD